MNFGAMKAETFRRLSESSGAPVFWTGADVEEALNEGYYDFAEQTRAVERSAEVGCVAQVPYMDARTALPYPFLGLRRVLSRQLNTPLTTTTIDAVDRQDFRWEMSSGSARKFMVRGLYTIGLWPVPNTRETFRMSWTSLPSRMVDNADEPELPVEQHEALILYALYDLKVQEDETTLALGYWQEYVAMIEVAKGRPKKLISKSRTFIMGAGYGG